MVMDFFFGFNDFSTELTSLDVRKKREFDRMWRVRGGGSIVAKPVIWDTMLVFADMDNHVYGVDIRNGRIKWVFTAGNLFFDSNPAVLEDGRVFIGCYDGYIYCINAKNGEELWRYKTNGEIGCGVYANNDMVLACSRDGNLYALTTYGKLLWKFKTGSSLYCTPGFYKDRIFIGSFDGNLYCLNKEGKELWRFKTGAEILATDTITIAGDVVYFASMDNFLYAVGTDGKELWRFKTGKYGNSSVPLYYNGILYYGARDGIFYAIDASNGNEIWRFLPQGKGVIDKRPLIYGDRIYIGSEDGNVYCLDMNGREIWRFKTGGAVFTSVITSHNMLFFGSFDCHLYAITLDGKEVWRIQTLNKTPGFVPPAYEAWETEIKTDTHGEEVEEGKEDRYLRSLAVHEFDSYKAKSEYAMKSEYTSKSEYK